MPEYLSPGVYVEEVPSGAQPIEGVSTSTAGFVGATERGPEAVQLVTSWLEYQRWYGGYPPADPADPAAAAFGNTFLPYAVQGFFDNGGQRCYIARVVHVDPAGVPTADTLQTSGVVQHLQFTAVGRGAWGNRIAVRIAPGSKPPKGVTNWFRVTILYYSAMPPVPIVDPLDPANNSSANKRTPEVVEDYDNLVMTPGAPNDVIATINTTSRLVRVAWDAGGPTVPGTNAFQLFASPAVHNDPALDAADYYNNTSTPYTLPGLSTSIGLGAFESIDDVSIVVIPDQARADFYDDLSARMIIHCEKLRDRFAVLSSVSGKRHPDSTFVPPEDSSFGAFYYPWIYVYDPVQDANVLVPPSGHMAGIYADTDIQRGVHKAPANAVVLGALDMEFPIPKGVQDVLNPNGVNCIRDFRPAGRGIRIWGARTMSSDPQWRYINVRRLFLYVEKSIDHGTQWVVFEPNNDDLWASVRRNLSNFLVRIWKSGALLGQTAADAFFVKCDRTTMTPDDLDNGRLICYVGIAPTKPAEFVIFRFSQKTLDASTQ